MVLGKSHCLQCEMDYLKTISENSHSVASLSTQVKIEPTTTGILKVLRDGSFERSYCDILHADEKRLWISSKRMLVVGSDVQITTSPIVLFGTVESCTRVSTGYLVLVHVNEVVDARPKAS